MYYVHMYTTSPSILMKFRRFVKLKIYPTLVHLGNLISAKKEHCNRKGLNHLLNLGVFTSVSVNIIISKLQNTSAFWYSDFVICSIDGI